MYVCVENGEWQLWSLKPLQFLNRVEVEGNWALCSPIPLSGAFFSEGTVVVTYLSEVVQREELPVTNVELAKFDNLGQILVFSEGIGIYQVGFATASSVHSRGLSAPITSRAVLLPFREMLFSIPLPHGVRGKLALFGESSLAVATLNGLCVLHFEKKVSQAISDGTSLAQFIRNSSLLNEGEIPDWIVRNGIPVRGLAWAGARLVVLCFSKEYRIDVISFSSNEFNRVLYSFPLTMKPLSLSVSGNRLLVGYDDQLSFHSLENGGKLVSTNSLGEVAAKRVAFLNSETIAVHTLDRRLFLISRSKVLHVFDDADGFQLTGSTAWPLLVLGNRWRVIGANNAELVLGDGMDRGLFLGIDGSSLFSVSPHRLIDFVHLVVAQSVSGDSLAFAVSILAQIPDDRRARILTDVALAVPETGFSKFLSLLERFPHLQDGVLHTVFQSRELQIDKREFLSLAISHGWYETASVLCSDVDAPACADLIIKSGFRVVVVSNVARACPALFEPTINITAKDKAWWRIEEELRRFLRQKLMGNDFVHIAQLLPFFHDGIKRFLLTSRRERETGQPVAFGAMTESMEKCSRQQLIALAGVFEETLAFDLLFCASYCLHNFAKCIECLERQQRMMQWIESIVLIAIGYTTA
jgi:hypothetical protein